MVDVYVDDFDTEVDVDAKFVTDVVIGIEVGVDGAVNALIGVHTDIDVGVERSLDDVENWKERDPISRLSKALIDKNIWSLEKEESYKEKLDNEIEMAWNKAMEDPYPENNVTLNYVFSNNE